MLALFLALFVLWGFPVRANVIGSLVSETDFHDSLVLQSDTLADRVIGHAELAEFDDLVVPAGEFGGVSFHPHLGIRGMNFQKIPFLSSLFDRVEGSYTTPFPANIVRPLFVKVFPYDRASCRGIDDCGKRSEAHWACGIRIKLSRHINQNCSARARTQGPPVPVPRKAPTQKEYGV
jgi:hypothetical protein